MSFVPASLMSNLLPYQVHGWRLGIYIICAAIVGILGLLGLMSVPPRYRKLVVGCITFIAGLYFSLEFLLPHEAIHVGKATLPGSGGVANFANGLTNAKPNVANWAMVIGSFAVLVGVSNLFQIHSKTIKKRYPGWGNSLAFFISFFLIIVAGFMKDSPIGWFGHANTIAIQTASAKIYDILFKGFIISLDATMFSLIAFYIVSAAYRAFRVRSAEAGLMMITAAIIMLGLVPVGAMITNWLPHTGLLSSLRLENITYWLLIWPNMAVQRAIQFGLAVGAMAMSLRIWLSLERGSFFDRQL